MPYSISWEARGVVWTYWGRVTGNELLVSNQEIYGDERFDLMEYQLVDLRKVDGFDVEPEEMIVVAATDRAAARSNPHVRVAVVAQDRTIKELSALYAKENATSPWVQRVFEDLGDARAWIAEGGG